MSRRIVSARRAGGAAYLCIASALALGAGAAQAQSPAMVQATPPAAAVERLNQNLSRLSRSPQDVTALLGAGQAALDLGDVQAANGFFTRANMVAPASAPAKLGLAIVNLALKQPGEAATYFDAADTLGEHAAGHLADRGLAYDLTGQQEKAQRDYQAALRANPADQQARLRYAVSLGISGQMAASEKQLEPALAGQDREAWRARAFVLAMNGRQAEARKISQTVMPKGLADALEPYMARVSLLTPAQKAAAFHYGEFPSTVLRAAAPAATPEAQPPRVLASATNKKRKRGRDRDQEEAQQPAALAAAEPAFVPPAYRESAPVAAPASAPAVRAPQPGFSEAGTRIAAASPPPVRRSASPRPAAPTPAPSPAFSAPAPTAAREPIFRPAAPATQPEAPATVRPEIATPILAQPQPQPAEPRVQGPLDPAASSPAPQPVPVTPVPVAAPRPRGLADALLAMNVPESERQANVAPVDLAAIARVQAERRKAQEKSAAEKAKREAAAKAKAEADAKAKAAAEEKARLARNPSRIWVQIATGRDVAALGFDMRRMRRSYADALGDQSGWTADWGATKRLLVGPYPSASRAREAAAAIKKSGGDAFVWMSEAGEEVARIGGK